MPITANILIVDDHQILVDGLRNLLEQHGNGITVSCATSVAEALALVGSQDFNLALLDIFFPGVDGFTFLKRCTDNFPVIVMSSTDDHKVIQSALDQGAAGFLSKGTSLETMLSAIEQALSGKTFVAPEIALQLSQSQDQQSTKSDTLCKELGITPQNLRVLLLIADGLSNKEIAQKIFLSTETVKSHTKQIFSALAVNNRLSAVNEARRIGLL